MQVIDKIRIAVSDLKLKIAKGKIKFNVHLKQSNSFLYVVEHP